MNFSNKNPWWKRAIDADEFAGMWGEDVPDGDIQVGDEVEVDGITGVVLEDQGDKAYVRWDGYKGLAFPKTRMNYLGQATPERFENAKMLDETETGFKRDYENSYKMIQDLGAMEQNNRPDYYDDELEDKFKRSSWWKRADPRFEENGQGKYDLKFDPGEENWMEDGAGQHFRVGDRVQFSDGTFGVVDEVNMDDYIVHHEETGEKVNAHGSELSPAEAAPGGPPSHEDHTRFEGGDPEAQDFEDPTVNLSSDWLDDQVSELKIGDRIHVFNPLDHNGEFLGVEGSITAVNGGEYTADTPQGTGSFNRAEIELLEDDNPHYRQVTSWWRLSAPEVRTLERDDARNPQAPKSPFKLDWDNITPDQSGVGAVPWYPDLPRYRQEEADDKNKPVTQDMVGKPRIPGKPSVAPAELARRQLVSSSGKGKGKTWDVGPMAQNVYEAYRWASPTQHQGGMVWYPGARQEAEQIVNNYKDHAPDLTIEKVVGVIAAISPNLSWEKNMLYPSQIIQQYYLEGIREPTAWREYAVSMASGAGKGKRKKMAIMNTNRDKVIEILDNGTQLDAMTDAPKTRNFYHNIIGDSERVTVDVWAMRICMGELKPLSNVIDPWTGERITYGGPSTAAYPLMVQAYQQAAEQINQEEGNPPESPEYVTPRELQAITWNVYRDLGVNAGIDMSEPPEDRLMSEEELQRRIDEAGGERPEEKPFPPTYHGPWDVYNQGSDQDPHVALTRNSNWWFKPSWWVSRERTP